MITSILCDIATSAFFLPLREASFQYLTDNLVFLDLEAAQAAYTVLFLYVDFLLLFVCFFLPALSLFPGETPAQEDRWLDDGN